MENIELPFKNFSELMQVFPTDTEAREFLEGLRWKGVPVCPHCGVIDAHHYRLRKKGGFSGIYKCKDCRKNFTVTVGTMFEGSHIGLRKWFIAMFLFSSHKKGISSHQLAKDLGITQKSAWFMLSLIRMSFAPKTKPQMEGIVMADESFIGGKNKNRHKDKKVDDSQGRSVKDKTPVFGLMNDGKVDTTVVTDTKASTLKPIIKEMVKSGSIMVTDEWVAYNGLSNDYQHEVVNHQKSEYVKDGFSTNALEGFWSLLKRGIYGIYHHVSPKHLNKYTDEFTYRYNTRTSNESQRFVYSIVNATKRISYKELILRPVI
jgi:transposase-like protein